jgi:hypothetical protein
MMSDAEAKSRAEIVRERRKESKRSRSRRKGKRKSHADAPPVMVRGLRPMADSGSKSKRKRKQRVKRRYDVALPTPGVEMRLPAVPQMQIGWRIVSFLISVGLSLALYFLWTAPTFQVQGAEVRGAERIPAYMIENAMYIHQRPIFVVEPDALERQLRRTFPGLTQVSVGVAFPARVVVSVEERVPVLAWEQGGRLWWIDAQGIAFPARGEVEALPRVVAASAPPESTLPEIDPPQEDGIFVQVFIAPEMIPSVLKLSDYLPNGAVLNYQPEHGFGWQDPRGWQVFFGIDVADIDAKVALYQKIVEQLEKEGVQPALINIEHLNAPYYRMEQ